MICKGFPVPGRFGAGVPLGNVERKHDFHGKLMPSVDPVDEHFCRCAAHIVRGNMHGCQHRRKVLGSFNIIYADDGNILRNPVAALSQRFDGADGSIVIGAENGSDIGLCIHEMVGALIAALMGQFYIGSVFLQERQPGFLQGFFEGGIAHFIVLLPDVSDFGMSKLMKVVYGAEGNVSSFTDYLVVFVSHRI